MRAFRVVAACALVAMAIPSAAAQEDGAGFVAEPGPGSELAPSGGYFVLEADPGEEIRQSIGLRNDSDEVLVLQLAPVDAVTGQLGGASYGLPEDPLTRAGGWITLERSTVELVPGASEIVPFEVEVPSDARSGTHLAGLSIAAPAEEGADGEAGAGEAGASIDVQTRRIIAVQVELPGPNEPELLVDGVAPAARPDGLYLEIAIENRGYGLTKASGTVTVEDDFAYDFDIDTFVPDTEIAYPVKWRTDAEEGSYRATVEIRYGDEVTQWEGELRVGDATLAELGQRQVDPRAQEQADDDPGPSLGLIVGTALVGAVLVGAGGYALASRRGARGNRSD